MARTQYKDDRQSVIMIYVFMLLVSLTSLMQTAIFSTHRRSEKSRLPRTVGKRAARSTYTKRIVRSLFGAMAHMILPCHRRPRADSVTTMSKRYNDNGRRLGYRRSAVLSTIKPVIQHCTRLPHGSSRNKASDWEGSFQLDGHDQLPSVRYLLVIALSPAGVTPSSPG